MDKKRFAVLGAYGNAGKPLCDLLLHYSDSELVLAGRNRESLMKFSEELNTKYRGKRVTYRIADAADKESLIAAAQNCDMMIIAGSTSRHTENVVRAALKAGVDYLDLQYSSSKLAVLQQLKNEIESSGKCFITEAGFHPGLPSLIARYASRYFDQMEKAVVSSVICQNWKIELSDSTKEEFAAEFLNFTPEYFNENRWQKLNIWGKECNKKIDFPPPFGKRYASVMMFEEMRALPEMYPSLKETGFWIAGFDTITTYFAIPLIAVYAKFFPKTNMLTAGKMLAWSLKTFSKPPYGVILRCDAEGMKNGRLISRSISMMSEDGYLFTAIPVAAALLQYIDGSGRKPGLWMMGHLAEPERMAEAMQKMGVILSVESSEL